MSTKTQILTLTRAIAAHVLEVVDAGLVEGLGEAYPGAMCVEAAVCFALGLPHGDDPACVSRALRALKIRLNDSRWSSTAARAKGLRRLAIAQLGSRDALDDKEFVRRVAEMTIRTTVSEALRVAAAMQKEPHKTRLLQAADKCAREGTRESALEGKIAADAAYAHAAADATDATDAADAAYDAYADAAAAADADAAPYADAAHAAAYAPSKRDESLAAFAERVVQILIELQAPGCQWLDLAPLEANT